MIERRTKIETKRRRVAPYLEHGQDIEQAVCQQANAHTHAWLGRSRQDHNPLQAQVERQREYHTHGGLQRRVRHVQERQVQRVGRGRPRQDSAPVATLLHRHAGSHFCH